jgi:formylglycine-generating enzyme required for sulfatase activity
VGGYKHASFVPPWPLATEAGVECASAATCDHDGFIRTVRWLEGGSTTTPVPPGQPFRDCAECPEMIPLPGGTFRMGNITGNSDGYSDELPVHSVTVSAFAMGKYEVTFEEYDKFCEATGRAKPSDSGWGRGKRPVINVSWHDAKAYTDWLSQKTGKTYRLPTEAQWEYAARAGTETDYWWGNSIGSNRANCYGNCGDSYQYTSPIGSFAANPFGLHDTAGNVWEWTCSEYTGTYNGNETICNNNANDSAYRSLRGGSWGSFPLELRSAYRSGDGPSGRTNYLGFRLSRIF